MSKQKREMLETTAAEVIEGSGKKCGDEEDDC
jgi:hypothetical protein